MDVFINRRKHFLIDYETKTMITIIHFAVYEEAFMLKEIAQSMTSLAQKNYSNRP